MYSSSTFKRWCTKFESKVSLAIEWRVIEERKMENPVWIWNEDFFQQGGKLPVSSVHSHHCHWYRWLNNCFHLKPWTSAVCLDEWEEDCWKEDIWEMDFEQCPPAPCKTSTRHTSYSIEDFCYFSTECNLISFLVNIVQIKNSDFNEMADLQCLKLVLYVVPVPTV